MQDKIKHYYQQEFSTISMYNSPIRLNSEEYFQNLSLNQNQNQEHLLALLNGNSSPFRYLLEGNIGVGKTALLKHIAYLWSIRKSLAHYDLVLYIDLSRLKEKVSDMSDIVSSYYKPLLDSTDVLSQFDTILYLCDGMDKIYDWEIKNEFLHILQFQKYTLITSRRYLIDINLLYFGEIMILDGFEYRFSNIGKIENADNPDALQNSTIPLLKYINKINYEKSNTLGKIVNFIQNDKDLEELSQNPLFLKLIIDIMISEEKNSEEKNSEEKNSEEKNLGYYNKYIILLKLIEYIILHLNDYRYVLQHNQQFDELLNSNEKVREEISLYYAKVVKKIKFDSPINRTNITTFLNVNQASLMVLSAFLETSSRDNCVKDSQYAFIHRYLHLHFFAYSFTDEKDFTEFNERLNKIQDDDKKFALYAFLNHIFTSYYSDRKKRERERVYEKFEKDIENIEVGKKIDLLYAVGIPISQKTFDPIAKEYKDKIKADSCFKIEKRNLMKVIKNNLIRKKE